MEIRTSFETNVDLFNWNDFQYEGLPKLKSNCYIGETPPNFLTSL